MKLGLKIILGLLVVLVVAGVAMWSKLKSNMKEIENEVVEQIDFSIYADGIYEGLYYYQDQIGAKVEVHIASGEVIDIILLDHVYGLGGKAESIIDSVILNQTLDVDYVSGATTSSKVILLAIENAMEDQE